MTGFLAYWEHFGKDMAEDPTTTPKQQAQAAFEAAQMDELLTTDWGDGYAEGYRQGVRDQQSITTKVQQNE